MTRSRRIPASVDVLVRNINGTTQRDHAVFERILELAEVPRSMPLRRDLIELRPEVVENLKLHVRRDPELAHHFMQILRIQISKQSTHSYRGAEPLIYIDPKKDEMPKIARGREGALLLTERTYNGNLREYFGEQRHLDLDQ